jgi:hypothetical protein
MRDPLASEELPDPDGCAVHFYHGFVSKLEDSVGTLYYAAVHDRPGLVRERSARLPGSTLHGLTPLFGDDKIVLDILLILEWLIWPQMCQS